SLRPAPGIELRRDARPDRQAARRQVERQRVAQLAAKRLDQYVAARLVDPARLARVAMELAVLEQLGDRLLERNVALAVDRLALGPHRVEQRRSGDRVSEPQAGREHLGKRADIDDARGPRP